jgi:hypothetical protein
MRIMKFKICGAFVGASLFIAPSLFAQIVGTGSLYITAPNYPPDQAGPYVVQISTVTSGPLSAGTTFQTFCIGSQVDYTPNNTYSYDISEVVTPSSVGTTFVTWGTAYLYSQFLGGALGVDNNSTAPASSAAALQENDALQAAIWDLQGQSLSGITFSQTLDTNDVNAFLTDAQIAAAAAGVGSDENNANGAFGIYALNMYSGSTSEQPELVRAPVPEPDTVFAGVFAGVLLLVPFGRNALGLVRTLRKRREA